MTQDEYSRLVFHLVNEVDKIKFRQHYLQIILEQVENPKEDTFARIALLISAYLVEVDCCLSEIQADHRRLKRVCNNFVND
jgi:hypothetical protein